ncbi:hypothetical protein [Micromonospora tulbaghiae]|uniref:hypothetical protein n=1 Tax=Micromonospora tulbaghiae TaxID=479978 RepID=UPI0033C52B56
MSSEVSGGFESGESRADTSKKPDTPYIDSVPEAATPHPTDQLSEWAREEQADLWHDLNEAINRAVNGAWSMQAANIARRIIAAARLVGPTPHGEIPWPLVAGGVYHAIYDAGNIPADVLDETEWRQSDALMADSAGTRATKRPRFAATVASINTERERKWISGEGE